MRCFASGNVSLLCANNISAEDIHRNETEKKACYIRYLNIVVDLPVLPCLIDSNGLVISLAPITNSDLTKMSEETQSVWVEVSSAESITVCKEVGVKFLSSWLRKLPKSAPNCISTR
ncbi:hypothetical protein OESDEN_13786 [Oesophagostomum dentatum]|uniref:Uncharacterized protein n=1 Tax=Oesophagostomum dentatum TaxID=61180 RepID=A0A0B1SMA1_OESDE|nr:hypothetical protein OESDEN_13786 [Oesophagostomum dentatum]